MKILQLFVLQDKSYHNCTKCKNSEVKKPLRNFILDLLEKRISKKIENYLLFYKIIAKIFQRSKKIEKYLNFYKITIYRIKMTYFNVKDFANMKKVSTSRAYSILHKDISDGKITKLASNLYTYSNLKKSPVLNKDLEKIREHLWGRGFHFSFTCMSVLERRIHHIPYSMIYHLYTEGGLGDSIRSEIKQKDIAFLIEPRYEEIVTLLEEGNVNKILIIRENRYLSLSDKGISGYEKALVDLYFEISRKKIPFMESELYYIAEALIYHNEINFSVLFNYAKLRKIFSEIKSFIKNLSKTSEIPEEVIVRYL